MAYVAKINGYDIKDAEARADLADEITARQSADTALGGRIDDEITARRSADTALGGRIDDEITARQSADTALGGRIDDEITARRSADTALGGKIGDLSELTTTATADLVAAINEIDSHADTNAANIAVIIGNDTGKSMREVAQEVSATVYTPQGSCTFANLPNLSAESTRVGFVYDVTDAFTTTSDFKEGAGIEVPAGTNVVVADVSGTKMWDLLGFNIDLSLYQKKVMTSSVTVGGVSQTTVEGAIGALAALPVDTVENGNMNPVTSNAVYDALMAVTSGTAVNDSDCVIYYVKCGKLVLFQVHALRSVAASKTIPFTCVHNGEGNKCSMLWSGELYGESYLDSPTSIKISASEQSSGMIPCILA